MKKVLRFLVLLAICFPAIASAQWTNEPAGSTTILDCPFNSVSGCGIQDAYSSSRIVQDSSGTVSPPNAVFSRIEAGATNGGMQLNYVFTQTPVRELYVGMIVRTNPEFQGRTVGNKMFFMRGPGMNGVFLYDNDSLSAGTGPMIFAHNTSGIDNSHTCALDSGLACFPNVGSGTITRGVQTKLEAYIKASTTATSRDGVVRWYVNGAPAGSYTNINYAPNGLNEWAWSETWDGFVNPPPTVPWEWYIDHLHISTASCPSGGCTTPPPPPPPPPPPTGGGTYSFATQFSSVQGQNQWSYRDALGNALSYNGTTSLYTGLQSFQTLWATGFHPGTTVGTVARWTAPSNGTAAIAGSVKDTDLVCGDGVTFQVKHLTTTLYTRTLNGLDSTEYAYSVSQSVTAGDTVDFIVTPGANNNCDSTMLNPVITFTPTGGTVPAPTVSGFTPTSGDQGVTVTVSGTNFAVATTGNIVKFNGLQAQVLGASTTSLTVIVPQGATTGKVSVETSSGTGTSSGDFTVTTPTPTRTVRIAFSHSGLDVNGNREAIDHFNVYRAPSIAGSYSKIGEVEGFVRVYTDPSAPIDRACYKFEPVDESNNTGAMSTPKCVYSGISPDADGTNPAAPFSVVPMYLQ